MSNIEKSLVYTRKTILYKSVRNITLHDATDKTNVKLFETVKFFSCQPFLMLILPRCFVVGKIQLWNIFLSPKEWLKGCASRKVLYLGYMFGVSFEVNRVRCHV